MIYKDNFRMLNEKEKSQWTFEHCKLCQFHECELVTEYLVNQANSCPQEMVEAIPVTAPTTNSIFIVTPKPVGKALIESKKPIANLPLYMRETWETEGCVMKECHQVSCQQRFVSDGIGNHFKFEIKYDYKTDRFKIDKDSHKRNYITHRWEPRQPVFISAQTGNGKNHFIEREVLKYVRELNHLKKTEQRVLILSNRIALRLQVQDRIDTGVMENDKIYYDYRRYADVISYQSVLNKIEFLRRTQKGKSNYIVVICDEAHFFTSDAMFNPHTEKILEAIIDTFPDAVRVYMTATPYECFGYIRDKEVINKMNGEYITPVMYHFKRNYDYLNTQYFSKDAELKDIIINSVEKDNEKWLVFIDDTKRCAAFKKMLEGDGEEATSLKGKVLTISAESKDKDEKYQQMILKEKFDKDINVVIATSVVDNGVNFRDIENVVITDMNRTKCIQMVGRVRVDKKSNSRVTLYIKRHEQSYISKRLKAIGVQQDAYHAYDMLLQSTQYKLEFLEKYYDNRLEDWENANHWFGRDKKDPDKLYPNGIARSLVDKYERIYESILCEMEETDTDDSEVTGQKYLEYQLSWFGKKYDIENDITLNGYKNNNQLEFEKWVKQEWFDKKIARDALKDFGMKFFEKYNAMFGLCTKKQGFSSDDNRGKGGPKEVGYSIKRINEIFQVRKMPFEVSENDGNCIICNSSKTG